MPKIKICGLTTLEDITAVNAAHPDYIGFVFAPSRRRVSQAQAAELKAKLESDIQAVGVFVNADIEEIIFLAEAKTIDLIQLHGNETAAYITRLKKQTDLPIIKAVRVLTSADIVNALSLPSDYLLFDTYVKDAYGGSGRTFNWSVIPPLKKPYFLAGGLDLDNITQAAQTAACCLDLSSGVETDGRKDPEKIAQIIEAVRRMS